MKRLNRYKIQIFITEEGNKYYTVIDTEYPLVRYQLYKTLKDAEEFVAGMYGLTPEEFKDLRRRKKNEPKTK